MKGCVASEATAVSFASSGFVLIRSLRKAGLCRETNVDLRARQSRVKSQYCLVAMCDLGQVSQPLWVLNLLLCKVGIFVNTFQIVVRIRCNMPRA